MRRVFLRDKTRRYRDLYIGLSPVDQCVHVLLNRYVLHQQDASSYATSRVFLSYGWMQYHKRITKHCKRIAYQLHARYTLITHSYT